MFRIRQRQRAAFARVALDGFEQRMAESVRASSQSTPRCSAPRGSSAWCATPGSAPRSTGSCTSGAWRRSSGSASCSAAASMAIRLPSWRPSSPNGVPPPSTGSTPSTRRPAPTSTASPAPAASTSSPPSPPPGDGTQQRPPRAVRGDAGHPRGPARVLPDEVRRPRGRRAGHAPAGTRSPAPPRRDRGGARRDRGRLPDAPPRPRLRQEDPALPWFEAALAAPAADRGWTVDHLRVRGGRRGAGIAGSQRRRREGPEHVRARQARRQEAQAQGGRRGQGRHRQALPQDGGSLARATRSTAATSSSWKRRIAAPADGKLFVYVWRTRDGGAPAYVEQFEASVKAGRVNATWTARAGSEKWREDRLYFSLIIDTCAVAGSQAERRCRSSRGPTSGGRGSTGTCRSRCGTGSPNPARP